jgi:peroxiredoxin
MRTISALPMFASLALAALAACGSGSSNPDTAKPIAEPAPMAEATPPATAPSPPEGTAVAPPEPAPQADMPAEARPQEPQFAVKETAEAELGTAAAGLGLKVGSKAPDGALPDVSGATVKLSALYKKGPTFLVFYRGGWCPFCNSQLHNLTEAKPEFDKRGVQLVAISVDQPGEEAKTQAKLGVPFPMLSDSKLKVHGAFKIVHKTTAEERQLLSGYGVDLQAYSGESHGNFATPAIFYVDQRGVIRFAHVGEDYQTRPSPKQMLAIADKLASNQSAQK